MPFQPEAPPDPRECQCGHYIVNHMDLFTKSVPCRVPCCGCQQFRLKAEEREKRGQL